MRDFSISVGSKTESQQEVTLSLMLEEMDRLNEMMRLDRLEIERIKSETSLAKQESQRRREESLEILDRLQTVV